jgi:hypothetical protein
MRRLLALVLIVGGAGPVAAQTNDHLFRSWRPVGDPTNARTAALGGAVAAGATNLGDVLINPATLASLTKTEWQAELRLSNAGSAHTGDALDATTGFGSTVFGWRATPTLAFAAFIARPVARTLSIDIPPGADGFGDHGSLDGSLTEIGVAGGWHAARWLDLGVSAAASRLALDGTDTRAPASGPADLVVDTTARTTAPTLRAGAVIAIRHNVRLGLAAAGGAAWKATRTSTSPVSGTVLDDGHRYEIRAPRVFSAAISVEPSLRLAVFGQADFVRYQDVSSGLAVTQGAHERAEYALRNAWEPRVGIELRFPHRTFSIVTRAGLQAQAPGLLSYVGTDPAEAAVFVGERRRTVPSLGAAVVTSRSFSVDVALRFGEATQLLAGGAIRF